VRLIKGSKTTFTIIPSVNDTTLGTITPATPQFVDSGATSPKFIFKPKNGNRFDSLTIGGVRVTTITLADTAYTIAGAVKNDTLKAWFSKIFLDSISDIEGNIYHTVKIGNQEWTVENLRTTKYNDGTTIPFVTDRAAWQALTTPGYCYDNNTSNADSIIKFGALYNWYAVNTKMLAPVGWHVSTDAEWDTLQNYLITNGYNWDGSTTGNNIAKAMAAKTDWPSSVNAGEVGTDLTKNNTSGFSALPCGYRNSVGDFGWFYDCYWWTATELFTVYAWSRHLSYGNSSLLRGTSQIKSSGFNVRLVKD
jgi:uncharacterized protein (TIGR02145 family)